MMKNAFYFMLNAIFVFEIFTCLDFLVMQKNALIRKLRLVSKLRRHRLNNK